MSKKNSDHRVAPLPWHKERTNRNQKLKTSSYNGETTLFCAHQPVLFWHLITKFQIVPKLLRI